MKFEGELLRYNMAEWLCILPPELNNQPNICITMELKKLLMQTFMASSVVMFSNEVAMIPVLGIGIQWWLL